MLVPENLVLSKYKNLYLVFSLLGEFLLLEKVSWWTYHLKKKSYLKIRVLEATFYFGIAKTHLLYLIDFDFYRIDLEFCQFLNCYVSLIRLRRKETIVYLKYIFKMWHLIYLFLSQHNDKSFICKENLFQSYNVLEISLLKVKISYHALGCLFKCKTQVLINRMSLWYCYTFLRI